MKLTHRIVADIPQMYHDSLANALYCALLPTGWAHPSILAAIRTGNI